jgi:hypothetical protein
MYLYLTTEDEHLLWGPLVDWIKQISSSNILGLPKGFLIQLAQTFASRF